MKKMCLLELSKLIHKFHNHTLPQSYNSFFQRITETHSHFTGSSASQNHFISRVGCFWLKKSSITYQGAVAWSSMPQGFKSFSYGIFSEIYKSFLCLS